jgi:hypothetical protein
MSITSNKGHWFWVLTSQHMHNQSVHFLNPPCSRHNLNTILQEYIHIKNCKTQINSADQNGRKPLTAHSHRPAWPSRERGAVIVSCARLCKKLASFLSGAECSIAVLVGNERVRESSCDHVPCDCGWVITIHRGCQDMSIFYCQSANTNTITSSGNIYIYCMLLTWHHHRCGTQGNT